MTCSTGKVSYMVRAVAKRAARTIKCCGGRRLIKGDGRLRPYRCPECYLWHLTSQAKRVVV